MRGGPRPGRSHAKRGALSRVPREERSGGHPGTPPRSNPEHLLLFLTRSGICDKMCSSTYGAVQTVWSWPYCTTVGAGPRLLRIPPRQAWSTGRRAPCETPCASPLKALRRGPGCGAGGPRGPNTRVGFELARATMAIPRNPRQSCQTARHDSRRTTPTATSGARVKIPQHFRRACKGFDGATRTQRVGQRTATAGNDPITVKTVCLVRHSFFQPNDLSP